MNRLEPREVEQFTVVAEELHFGRAAERLGITQPALSRTIGRLERRLGVRLFERTTRRVVLTPAGEVFQAECHKVLDAMDIAVRRTRRVSDADRLTVAVRPGAGPGVLADLINAYRRTPGAAPTEIVFTYDEAEALRDGTADLALMCASPGMDDLSHVELGLERPVALLPTGHDFAVRTTVTMADLRELDAFATELPHEALDVMVDRVALGLLVVIVGESVLGRLGDSVVTVPVEDYPVTRLVLAWPPDTLNTARAALIDAAGTLTPRPGA